QFVTSPLDAFLVCWYASFGKVSHKATQLRQLRSNISSKAVFSDRGSCPMFWYSFNGRCYKYLASPMSWADAQLHCMSLRANLVSIHSQQEQNFVNSLIRNFDPAVRFTWIGLNDIYKEGRWMWSDASQSVNVYNVSILCSDICEALCTVICFCRFETRNWHQEQLLCPVAIL
uniref:C-type lectin domain-containing protein n=1 Tax=Stegastes partitus TaxID=144197 RepID=A0A3B4ZP06_9TELE